MPEKNEGYEIIAAETYSVSHTGQESRIVLAHMNTRFGKMFVTWESTRWPLHNNEAKADYYWGHYFSDDENAARADYHKRLMEKYERKGE